MFENTHSNWSISEMRERCRNIETDLRDQGIKVYPRGRLESVLGFFGAGLNSGF